jgi:hypothetical protein
MPRPQFENQTLISAVTSKSIGFIEGTITTPQANGVYQSVILYSAPNTISRVMNVRQRFGAITDAGAVGTNKKYMYINTNWRNPQTQQDVGIGLYRIRGNCNVTVEYDKGEMIAGDEMQPNDHAALNARVTQAVFDETVGLAIVFMQQSGVTNTTGERYYLVMYEQEVVKR